MAKKIIYKNNKSGWFKQNVTKASVFIITVIISVGYVITVEKLSDKRIHRILSNELTNTTTALVTDIQQRQSRGGIYYVAIITYQVGGIEYEKAIGEGLGDFKSGEKYTLKYSVEFPEMFEVYR